MPTIASMVGFISCVHGVQDRVLTVQHVTRNEDVKKERTLK